MHNSSLLTPKPLPPTAGFGNAQCAKSDSYMCLYYKGWLSIRNSTTAGIQIFFKGINKEKLIKIENKSRKFLCKYMGCQKKQRKLKHMRYILKVITEQEYHEKKNSLSEYIKRVQFSKRAPLIPPHNHPK